MIQELTKLYDGANLSGATAGVIYLPILRASSLKGADIKTDENTAGDAVFEILKNGVVISGLETVTISTGTKIETVTGLNIALAKGDEILLNLLSGAVSSPVTLNLSVDVTVGADEITEVTDRNFATDAEISKIASSFSTTEEIQDIINSTLVAGSNITLNYNDTANTLTIAASGGGSSNGFSYFDPDVPYSSPSAFDDEFNGTTLDAKWSTRGAPVLTHDNPYSFSRFVGTSGINGVYQAYSSASGSAIFRMKVTPIGLASGNDNQAGGLYFKKATTAFGIEFVKTNEYFTLAATFWTNVTTFNSNQATHASIRIPSGTPVWLELDFNFTSGNVTYRYSLDGINFGLFFNDVSNASGTVEVGIKAPSNASNSALKVDWFRKVDGTGFTGKKVDL